MSATGRGTTRHPDDFYETPAWCVRRYLERAVVRQGRWLEPGAGRGAIVRAVNAYREKEGDPPLAWTAVEISKKEGDPPFPCKVLWADFLSPEVSTTTKYDLCLGNPPFKLALEFIEKGLECAHVVAYLLRLNFLEGNRRAEFFKKHACDVFVLPNRPSFVATGKTDATAYAWFEFGGGASGHITVLDTTPKAERLADRVAAV